MDFFPSSMSICKLWQKHNYALESHELNFPQMETFKGNPVVFSNVCFCVQHQAGKAALGGLFTPNPTKLLHFWTHLFILLISWGLWVSVTVMRTEH